MEYSNLQLSIIGFKDLVRAKIRVKEFLEHELLIQNQELSGKKGNSETWLLITDADHHKSLIFNWWGRSFKIKVGLQYVIKITNK